MTPPSGPRRVLVVDDDDDARAGLVAILERARYEVHQASSGNEAIEVYLERTPHVVVTDVVMTDGDGLDLVTTLRRLRPNVAVIAVTGQGPSAAAAAKGMAVHRVLLKPVDAAALVEAVRGVAGGEPLAEELEG